LYVLEAWANGIPVVQPRHGSFPELIEATHGGMLVEPENPIALSDAIRWLCENEPARMEYGRNGHAAVHEQFTDQVMARKTLQVLEQYLPSAEADQDSFPATKK
jgi:glycosyltransferase involved in cell wall biosynthesis